MSEPVRWGVLSGAAIARNKVIPAMQQADNCEIVGIASRDADRATELADELGIPKSYGSYDDLLADPDIEAVYIPLPNHLHAEWTFRSAEAGKHVLCEKPLALTAEQARHMVEACRTADVLLMEAFMYRHHPQWVRAREIVDSGRIGEVHAIEPAFAYHNVDPQNIRNIAEMGGGALMDIGCYPVNVARMIFGCEPEVVSASVRRDPTFRTDVLTSAVLDFGGRHAVFTCATQLEPHQRVLLHGTKGTLLVEIPFNIPPDRSTRLVVTSGGNPPVAPDREVIELPAADQYAVQGELFSAAVRAGGPVPVAPEDAVANMRVIERVFAAASANAST